MIDFGARNEAGFEDIELRYTAGLCQVMAIQLHERFGLPIRAIWDTVIEGFEDDPGALVHYFVELPDGRVADVRGVATLDELLAHWGFSASDLDNDWLVKTSPSLDDIARRCPPSREEMERCRQDLEAAYPDLRLEDVPQP